MDLPTTHYDENVTSGTRPVSGGQGGLLSKISLYLVLLTAFLAPLVFVPSAYAPLDVIKAYFLGFAVLATALVYTINAVKYKTLSLPRSVLGYSTLAIIISTLISVFASGNPAKTFFGQGFELTTASFILLMVVASYVISRLVVKDRETIFKIYSAVLVAFIVLALFHIVRLFAGPSFLSFGVLNGITATVMGKWYDFAVFTGAIGFISLLGIKFLPLRPSLRRILIAALIVSGLLLYIVNSAFIWGIVAIVSLAVAAYEFAIKAPQGNGAGKFFSRVSILTAIVFVAAVALAWKGDKLALPVVSHFKAEYGELVLPWQMTLDIASDTLKESPLFGAGPNRFSIQYLHYKPLIINQTPFWNAEFSSGFGLVPTMLVTQGIVGAVVWFIFLLTYIIVGIKGLRRMNDPLKRFFISSSFFASLFLWIVDLVYVPSHVVVYLTAILTGIVVGLLVSEGVLAERVIAIRQGAKSTKLVPVVFYAAVIVLAIWLGAYAKKAIAITYFQKGIKVLNVDKSPEKAQALFKQALTWDVSDVYYQALSETNIIKINTLAQSILADAQSGAKPDQAKSDQVVALITEALKYTKAAQVLDERNFYNYVAEARISEIGTTLKIPNAYENAKAAYANAILANPTNPALFLNLARLEAAQGHIQDAQQYVGRALQLKQNYIDAVFLLSQLQVANNQIKDAMTSTQVAIQLNPQEPLLYFQLGLLAYSDKEYTLAIQALEKAVSLNNVYANAKYFLGLSYARMGRNADAIAQFEDLATTNPDNKEVAFILGNLKEGRSPFADAQPPIDSKPEKRKTLPVTEKEKDTSTTTASKKKSS